MTRAAFAAFLLLGCGSVEPPAPFDVHVSPRQYNALALAHGNGELDVVEDCPVLCLSPAGVPVPDVGSCHLAVTNDGTPVVRCVRVVFVPE